jgi:hypothetical protein
LPVQTELINPLIPAVVVAVAVLVLCSRRFSLGVFELKLGGLDLGG